MLQPSAISSPISMELTESLQQTLSGGKIWKLKALGLTIPLPNTARGFLLFLLGLAVVCGGMVMQITLSIQIWQTTAKIDKLKAEYRVIEQQNTAIVWEIAQTSTLESVRQRAQALNYKIVMDRYYIAAPGSTQLATTALPQNSQPKTIQSAVQAQNNVSNKTSATNSTDEAKQMTSAGFANNLQAATHALRQWWQKQWQSILQSS
ncbi:MAG: hypothetical protein NT075_02055 [Chloroflexi bacterium]|nr:hypothetical protein [Chloroflexota bacterium]